MSEFDDSSCAPVSKVRIHLARETIEKELFRKLPVAPPAIDIKHHTSRTPKPWKPQK